MSEGPEGQRRSLRARLGAFYRDRLAYAEPSKLSPSWLRRWQKTYDRPGEIARDRWAGAVAFVLINWLLHFAGPAWIGRSLVLPSIASELLLLLPWIVNGLFVLLAFLFRPQIAAGYLMLLGSILLIGVGLFAVLVGSCIVAIPLMMILPPLGGVVWFILLIAGLFLIVPALFSTLSEWWSSEQKGDV